MKVSALLRHVKGRGRVRVQQRLSRSACRPESQSRATFSFWLLPRCDWPELVCLLTSLPAPFSTSRRSMILECAEDNRYMYMHVSYNHGGRLIKEDAAEQNRSGDSSSAL